MREILKTWIEILSSPIVLEGKSAIVNACLVFACFSSILLCGNITKVRYG